MITSSSSFALQAEPNTDIWRKPPTTNTWSAPITRTSTGPIKKFRSARATFWAPWTERYDQAGLLLVPRPASSTPPVTGGPAPAKWIKTGIEYYQGQPQLSTVGCDRYADWSIGPITTGPVDPSRGVTVEIVREMDELGRSAWIYQLEIDPKTGETTKKVALREITWIFADEDARAEGQGGEEEEEWVIDVSPLVARPEKNAAAPLTVEFKEFTVVWDGE